MIGVTQAAALFVATAGLLASNETPAAIKGAGEYEVAACLQFDGNVNFAAVSIGKIVASDLFHRIGVRLRWKCRGEETTVEDFGEEILIRFMDSGQLDRVHRTALAYARPYAKRGVRVVVFYDRLGPVIANRPLEASSIMGYVFAHEIAHVLMGVDSHEPDGLMRARWTNQDFHAMEERLVGFTSEEGERIRDTLRTRSGRPANASELRAVTLTPNSPASPPKPGSLAPSPPVTQTHPDGDSRRRGTE